MRFHADRSDLVTGSHPARTVTAEVVSGARVCSRFESVPGVNGSLGLVLLLVWFSTFPNLLGAQEVGSGINENEATLLRHFTFEARDDEDYDGHPDDWSRRVGQGFPAYVKSTIDRSVAREGRQSLRFDLNGGPAAIYSPPLLIDQQYSLLVRGAVRTKGLSHSVAVMSVSLLDHRRKRLSRHLSRPVGGTHAGWIDAQIGPIHPDPQARFVVIGCHILDGDRSDITGAAWFDDIRIGRLPRMTISYTPDRHVLSAGQSLEIRTDLLGMEADASYDLELAIADLEGRPVFEQVKALPAGTDRGGAVRHAWTVPPQRLGHHRVIVRLQRGGREVLSRDTAFAVVDETERVAQGEFGWSLERGFEGLSPVVVADLTNRAHLHHLKLPLWSAAELEKPGTVSPTTQLLDLLEGNHVHVIGLLNDPPPSLRAKFVDRTPSVSKILSLPRPFWSPSLEPLIVRYAFRIKEWQLGDDADAGYAGLTQLPEIVEGARSEFDRIGRNTEIILPWPGTQSLPPQLDPAAVSLSVPAIRPAGISHSALLEPAPGVAVDPARLRQHVTAAPRATAPVETRAADLALTVLRAKLGNAVSVTYQDPLDPECGLFRRDGAPTELFLPWRQLSSHLGGAEYLGRILLPNRTHNAVFRRDSEVFVMLWSERPNREQVSFGYEARIYDLWGRPLPSRLEETTGQIEFETGPTPILLRHCAAGIVEWYLAVRFEQGRLRSEYGEHPEALLGTNPFGQGVSGKVSLRMPAEWDVEPGQWELQAAAGEKWRLPMLITFPPNGTLGDFYPEVDFQLAADRPYRFTVHLPYTLGLEDFELNMAFRKLPDGRLEVEQQITNRTQPPEMLDFECSLFVPGQVRQKLFVPKLGAGEDRRIHVLPDAEGLRGKEIWLRCEQVDGRRVLNLRKKVEY